MIPKLTQNEIRELKENFNIFAAYHALGLPGEPKKVMRSPFRQDIHPSFSIYNKGQNWKDFSTGESGDVISFIGKIENLQPAKAFIRFLELAGHFLPHQIKPQTTPPPRKLQPPRSNLGTPTQIYPYQDENKILKYQILRYDSKEGKTFLCRRPDLSQVNPWIYNLEGCQAIPYRLPEILEAVQNGSLIIIVEGEKDVETLRRNGFVATCNHGGAGNWKQEFSRFFKGGKVVVIPDNDERGMDHSREVIRCLHPVVSTIKVLELPHLPPKGDVSDWLLCHSLTDLHNQISLLLPDTDLRLLEIFKKLNILQHSFEKVLTHLSKIDEKLFENSNIKPDD